MAKRFQAFESLFAERRLFFLSFSLSSFKVLFLGRIIRADPYDPFIENILNPSEKMDHQITLKLIEIFYPMEKAG